VRLVRLSLVLAALVAALAGCRDPRTQSRGCNEDKECIPEGSGHSAAAYRCETQTGACYCRSNEACPAKQFCNLAGFCQDRTGCEKNDDCLDPTLFCDTTSGTCLSKGRCTVDLHCPLGQVCDLNASKCVDGCRTSGDCNGSSCRCPDGGACLCSGTTAAELARCEMGTCDPNFCANADFCRFGEVCSVVPDAGSTLTQCNNDYHPQRRPYCDNCSFGGGTQVCGTGANYCLIDTANPGNQFCGVDCSQGQSCPRGYNCSDVIVVFSQWQCTRANPRCPINQNLPCAVDKDCKRGGSCLKDVGAATGFCAPKCSIDEGDNVGFCSCLEDLDCAQETCSAGECTISRRKCVTDAECRPIRCVDYQGAGGCLIGQNCAPANGLSCLQTRQ
jgi:hypothetical protein